MSRDSVGIRAKTAIRVRERYWASSDCELGRKGGDSAIGEASPPTGIVVNVVVVDESVGLEEGGVAGVVAVAAVRESWLAVLVDVRGWGGGE